MSKNKKALKEILDSARDGELDAIRDFISDRKAVNAQGPDGRTILINAAANRHGEIVKIILKSGADINLKTNSGKTALNYALCSAFGFDIGGKKGSSSTLEVVRSLLGHNCQISKLDIAFAILFHDPEVLAFLLKRVSQNNSLLAEALDYVGDQAFEYNVDEALLEKKIALVRAHLL